MTNPDFAQKIYRAFDKNNFSLRLARVVAHLSIYFLLLSCIFLASIEAQTDSNKTYYKQGSDDIYQQNFAAAVDSFQIALKISPEDDNSRRGLAIALVGVEKYPEASREIAKLLARNPKNGEFLELAAQVFWQQNRFQEAEITLKRRLDLGAPTAELFALYGDALEAQKRTVEAADAYRKAVELNPASIDFRYALGSLYWKLYLYEKSEKEYLEILRRQPKEPRSSFNLGDIYLSRGDAAKAISYLEISAKEFPKEFDPQFALGRAYFLLKDYPRAVIYLETAVEIRPEIAEGYYQLGLALRRSGKLKESQTALEKAKELQKDKLNSEKKLFTDQ